MDDDAQSELKRRARRRLVGATALALAAVIVLPMVMDHEPRVPAQEIQVRIPSQDGGGGLVSRILPGKGSTALPPLADSQPAAQPGVSPKVDTKAEAKTEPKIEPKAEANVEAKAEVKATPKVEPKPAPVAAKAEPQPPAKAAEGARAAAALSGQGSGTEQWVVQLGAYKEAGNVKLLMKKLKEMGVPSYTEEFDSPQGPRTRVRAGPFATKEAAEKAQVRAKAIGVSGTVAPK
ncbi:SPOR domain-containing protein [Sulfurisoma sediminicola]|uniref:DedD protein n=1 Tax=Sulfurisoma sediminicola TaxID=1381557 RepID=A0A497XAC6_9PROT|nr:SPOR domain-containing protein [Sulfurisoma sediminicola]RLJ62777.1 DedD protein [Sulfurisoma sediminicola]